MDPCSKEIILALLVIAVVYMLMNEQKESLTEPVEEVDSEVPMPEGKQPVDGFNRRVRFAEVDEEPVEKVKQPKNNSESTSVTPYVEGNNEMNLANPGETQINLGKCGGNNGQFLSSNLLPSGASTDPEFSEFSPANLKGKNFIDSAKFLIGTQSQSLRNANYQLRSEPPNPQEDICAWNNTTIAPESLRRPLDIGTKAM